MATLFIGIGSSGLAVLEEAQQFNYEFTGQNKPSKIHYLYLETDLANKPRETPLGTNNITGIKLSLENMSSAISQLRNNKNIDSSWIPDATAALATSGAGGKSSYGRLSLWANFNNVKNGLLSLNHSYNGFDTIYVVGSLTGGTGSGILIDLAYLLRHLIPTATLFSILMIPKESDLAVETQNFFINSFYAIKALEYYTEPKNKFNIIWPDSTPLSTAISPKAPFDTNIIVSPDYFTQSGINNTFMCDYNDLSPLFKTIGLYVSLLGNNISRPTPSLQDASSARWIDGAGGAGHIDRFVTIGLSLIQYPKALIEEYLALEYATEIVGDWISTNKYQNKNVSIQKRAKIDVEKSIDYVLENELNNIKQDGSSSVNEYISVIGNKIAKKTIQPSNSTSEFINNIFNSDDKTNLYQNIKTNGTIARDAFALQIIANFNKLVSKFPNLDIAKLYLNSVTTQLDESFDFWEKEYGIDDNPANWTKILGNSISRIEKEKSKYGTFGLTKEFYIEQLNNIATLLKLHLVINEFRVIKEHLLTPTNTFFVNKEELPSLSKINTFEQELNNVVNGTNEGITFAERSSGIESMSLNYGMIYNLYPTGNFNSEVNSLKATINLNKTITPDLILSNNTNLWKFLLSKKNIYFDIIPPLVQEINNGNNTAIQLDALIRNTAKPEIQNLISEDLISLQYTAPALIKLDTNIGPRSIFQDSPFLTTIYMYNGIANMDNIRNSVRNNLRKPTQNLNANTFVDVNHMQNAIAIFKSFGYYGGTPSQSVVDKSLVPTRDLISLKNTESQFIDINNLQKDRIERIPYFSEKIIEEILINKKKDK